MELKEILDIIVSYDPTKPWEIIIYQYIFSSLRNCCLDRIVKSFDVRTDITDTIGFDWDDLYELCYKYGDPHFKEYINDFFDPEHYSSVEDSELLEIFCKNFIRSLDVVITNGILENDFITFLDETIFTYFATTLKDTDLHIFPKTIDDLLDEEVYKTFRAKEIGFINDVDYEIIYEPVEINTEFYKKRSITHLLHIKKTGLYKSLKRKHVSLTNTRRNKNIGA